VDRLGVITGLAREAGCFSAFSDQDDLLVRCVGGNPQRAADAAHILVSEGCRGLVSFGIAGGLHPALGAGTLVVASSVIGSDGTRLDFDHAWQRRLMSVLEGEVAVVGADVYGSDGAVVVATEKRRIHQRTGAAAVDMESKAVARTAAECGVAFLAVRAIADPADRDVPAWVSGLIGEDGRPSARSVVAGLAAHPWHIPVLLRLAMDSEKAFAALRRVTLAAGPFLQVGA
jgi:hopanoid-associated phosphorylase